MFSSDLPDFFGLLWGKKNFFIISVTNLKSVNYENHFEKNSKMLHAEMMVNN